MKEAVEVLGRIGALDAQRTVVWDKTTDTQEACREIIRRACEAHLVGFQDVVGGQCADMSRPARQLAFLLLREESVRKGEVYDGGGFGVARRILFSEDLLPEAFEELVSVGLLYKAFEGEPDEVRCSRFCPPRMGIQAGTTRAASSPPPGLAWRGRLKRGRGPRSRAGVAERTAVAAALGGKPPAGAEIVAIGRGLVLPALQLLPSSVGSRIANGYQGADVVVPASPLTAR